MINKNTEIVKLFNHVRKSGRNNDFFVNTLFVSEFKLYTFSESQIIIFKSTNAKLV